MSGLTTLQRRGLCRTGDALVPAGNGFPAFSGTDAQKRAGEFLGYMPEGDRRGLLGLLSVLACLPPWTIRPCLKLVDRLGALPGGLGAPMRMISLGLKGLVYTLYYDDPAIHERIGWDARIAERLP